MLSWPKYKGSLLDTENSLLIVTGFVSRKNNVIGIASDNLMNGPEMGHCNRLKETRLWTDGAIRRWLGEPQQQGKYKVFPVEAVLAAEKLNEFRLWLKPRLEKKRAQHHHF